MKLYFFTYLPALLIVLLFSTCNTSKTPENCIAIANPDCVCTMQYDPVCGCNKVTYSNACVAVCNNIKVYTAGECP